MILDIYSRYVVGWMVASRESAALAEVLIRQTCAKQGIGRDQLTIHADRGSSMTSKPVAFLLADLGITQSHSRPHVSNDNPFSEAQFKTLKYRPDFPGRFDLDRGGARALPSTSSLGTTTSIATPGWRFTRPPTSTTAPPKSPARSGPACSTPRTPHTRNASSASHRGHPKLPTETWINRPDNTEEATQ